MTQLKVMDDRISLWNAGALPDELTVDQLFQEHESFPRNPLIAEVCYRVGYIDSWGRGIEKITDACKQAGLPDPVIVERTGGIAVELMKTQVSEKAASESSGDDFGKNSERIRNWASKDI